MQVISTEELFFLGKLMNAYYIDYDYLRLMKEIKKNGALKENEILVNLVKRGIIYEDFFGTKEIEPKMQELLYPVFFGKSESEIVIYDVRNDKKELHKVHYFENNCTHVQIINKELHINKGIENLQIIRDELITNDYKAEKIFISMKDIEGKEISLLVVLKNIHIGIKSTVCQLIFCDNCWFVGKDSETVESLEREEMIDYWNQIMKGDSINGLY